MNIGATKAPPTVEFTGCCARFDPTEITDEEVQWRNKLFMREHVRTLFHVPLNMGSKVQRALARIRAADAMPERPLMLGEDLSPWRADIYLEATKDVPGGDMVRLSGGFLRKVFEGPYKDAPRWEREMEQHLVAHGKQLRRLLYGYTTCPACSKAYAENYVVLYAQVAP